MRYLFEPWLPPLEIEKETHPGLPGLIMDSILSCPMDFRNSLWNETVLAGATTLCPGLPNYLSKVRIPLRALGKLTHKIFFFFRS